MHPRCFCFVHATVRVSVVTMCPCVGVGVVSVCMARFDEVVYLVRKRLSSKNFRVVFLAATLAETLVQNCGRRLHQALASERFMAEMADVVRVRCGEVSLQCSTPTSVRCRPLPRLPVVEPCWTLVGGVVMRCAVLCCAVLCYGMVCYGTVCSATLAQRTEDLRGRDALEARDKVLSLIQQWGEEFLSRVDSPGTEQFVKTYRDMRLKGVCRIVLGKR